jgi:hypothetical protein
MQRNGKTERTERQGYGKTGRKQLDGMIKRQSP